jgi:hypothetical protein
VNAGAAGFEQLDAAGFGIDRDDGFAVGQEFREIADAASDFEDPAAQFRQNESRLPREIVPRARHALLIFDNICGTRYRHRNIHLRIVVSTD